MFQKTVLDNSIRIITEKNPSRTVSVGIWVDVGSRDEQEANNGCAHFVEHMLFKGTARRSATRIAQELDMLGGMSNAFTSSDTTCFYATVLDDKLYQLMDLLADLFLNSVFDQKEVEREREVVLQEISMVEDTPDDRVHEIFTSQIWGGHPLGHTVLGRREVVAAMDSGMLLDYVERFYTPDKIVIAAAGNLDHGEFCRFWQKALAEFTRSSHNRPQREKPQSLPSVRKVYKKPLEQLHMVLGSYGLPMVSAERYHLYLLNIMLGGNMSSRLFQEVRERHGLAYSVYSYVSSFIDSGYLGIYLGMDPGSANKALELIAREIASLRQGHISKEELANAKDYAKAGVFLAAENMESRMTRIARNELSFGRYIDFDEVVAGFDKVGLDDIVGMAEYVFAKPLFAAAIGPIRTADVAWQPLDMRL
ncbi:MAG: insulinase family protein [Desulfobulbaceae bacterium]|nr:insulinase family protein [Desulfobulbaceae bacterium]HIJ77712.1 insulinase family protein [Deltaproteobacteria bacterium]